MFRLFSGLFKSSSGEGAGLVYSTRGGSIDAAGTAPAPADRYRFNATMALCTPLEVLLRHGEEHPGPAAALPKYSDGQEDGVWQHQLGTWKELGEVAKQIESRMASAVGSIPRDGGNFLIFLKSFREIVESGDSQRNILDRTQRLIETKEAFRHYAEKLRLDDADRVLRYLEQDFDGFPCGHRLRQAGYRSRAQVRRASDPELLAVNGIGKYRLRLIRAALSPMSFQSGAAATAASESVFETIDPEEVTTRREAASQLASI